jgi:hypothetical protein
LSYWAAEPHSSHQNRVPCLNTQGYINAKDSPYHRHSPQFIKASVVSKAIQAVDGLKEVLVHTGQHFSNELVGAETGKIMGAAECSLGQFTQDAQRLDNGGQAAERIAALL